MNKEGRKEGIQRLSCHVLQLFLFIHILEKEDRKTGRKEGSNLMCSQIFYTVALRREEEEEEDESEEERR